MLMVEAGAPVDSVIDQLVPLLSPGDVIMDGGNSYFKDTERRTKSLEQQGLLYIGTGVSGGEEGARRGPSIMPGGTEKAWPLVQPILQAISAKVGPHQDVPCCDWVGPRGAGHYVKMVHNGIEYGDMQLICEAYAMLKHAAGLSNDQLYDVFAQWNRGELQSYLIEITRDIFSVRDELADGHLVDKILDRAGAKGTGKWMSQDALDLGMPSTLVTTAVYARCLSAQKDARVQASQLLSGPAETATRPQSAYRRSHRVHRESPASAVRVQDRIVRARIRAVAGGGPRIRVAAWTTDCAHACGGEGALFEPSSSSGSWKRLRPSRTCRTCCCSAISRMPSRRRMRPGAMCWLSRPGSAYPFRPSAPLWPIMTAIAAASCRPICCRPNAITSAPTSTNGSIARESSTPTGCRCAGHLRYRELPPLLLVG